MPTPGFGVQKMISTPEVISTKEILTAVIHLVIPGRDMPKYMDPAIQEILKVLSDQGIKPVGPMFSYHHRMPSDTFDFEIGFPVDSEIKPMGRVQPSELPAAHVARTIHHGPYEGLSDAWREFGQWVKTQGLDADSRFYERYLDDPTKTAPSEYRTEINRILIDHRPNTHVL